MASPDFDFGPLEQKVPFIERAKGPNRIELGAVKSHPHIVAELHAGQFPLQKLGGYCEKATTARPLIVGRVEDGSWWVKNLDTGELLGLGETKEDAIKDAKANDVLP